MTKAGEESRAQRNLESQGFNVYGPTIKGSTKRVALFPGYVFARMDVEDMNRYHRIRNTPGVFLVVCFNRIACCLYAQGKFAGSVKDLLPRPIRDGEALMKEIHLTVKLMNQPPAEVPRKFQPGDQVTCPLFEDLNTEFAKQLSGNRSLVLIQHLQRRRGEDNMIREEVNSERRVVVETCCLEPTNEPAPRQVDPAERICEICTKSFIRASYGFDAEGQPVRVGPCCQGRLSRLLDTRKPEDRILWQRAK